MVATFNYSKFSNSRVEAVRLRDLISKKNRETVEQGIIGSRRVYGAEAELQTEQEWTAIEAFRAVAIDVLGCQKFCEERRIPWKEQPSYLLDLAAKELDLPPSIVTMVVESITPEQCIPATVVAEEGSELPLWYRIQELAADLYVEHCPTTVKYQINRIIEKGGSLGERVKTDTEKCQSNLAYQPAPACHATRAALKFRDELTASKLREWRDTIAVKEPFNQERWHMIDRVLQEFQRNGLQMEDGQLSVKQAEVLNQIRGYMPLDVMGVRCQLREAMQMLLARGHPQPDGQRKAEVTDLGLEIVGDLTNFSVFTLENQKVVMAVRGQDVIRNDLPPTIACSVIAQANLLERIQQQLISHSLGARAVREEYALDD